MRHKRERRFEEDVEECVWIWLWRMTEFENIQLGLVKSKLGDRTY